MSASSASDASFASSRRNSPASAGHTVVRNRDTGNAENSGWLEWLPALFTEEQQQALAEDVVDADTHPHIHRDLPRVPEHHAQLLNDLQLGNVEDANGLFRQHLDRTITSAGRHTLRAWLEHPQTTAAAIRDRAALRKRHCEGGAHARLVGTLGPMESDWKALCWCWHDDTSKTELVNCVFFSGVFEPLNRIPLVQNIYHHMRVIGTPLVHCLAPLVPVLIAYVMMRWMGADVAFKECWDMSTGILKNTLWFDDGSAGETLGKGGAGGSNHPLAFLFGGLGTQPLVPLLLRSMKWIWWLVFVANIVLITYQCYRHYKLLAHVYAYTHRAVSWLRRARELVVEPSPADAETRHALDTVETWAKNAPPAYTVFTHAHDFLHAYTVLRSDPVRKECARLVRHVGVMDALQSVEALVRARECNVPVLVDSSDALREKWEAVRQEEKAMARSKADQANKADSVEDQADKADNADSVEDKADSVEDQADKADNADSVEDKADSVEDKADKADSVDDSPASTTPTVPEASHQTASTETEAVEGEGGGDTPPDDAHAYPAVYLDLRRAYHPKLDRHTQTTHDLRLHRHVVLTGSNASGKSTVLKTLLLNVLLAQSWGVCCAERMHWTPFRDIRGYLHTVDDCGKESLFQAQIRRIEESIEAATASTENSLIVVDEILNSTNPIEAMLLSYQYSDIIGQRLSDRARLVMTTHYPVLTTLAKARPEAFANWAMGDAYKIRRNQACDASSAIGTVRAMTRVLQKEDHTRLEAAYAQMYRRLVNMEMEEHFREEPSDACEDSAA